MLRAMLWTAVLLAGPAMADDCPGRATEILTLTDWSLAISKDGLFDRATLTLTYRNDAAKPIAHVDAYAVFRDRWGGFISTIATRTNPGLAPGAVGSETASYFGTGLDRIPSLDRADIVAGLCVDLVVYEDGTKESF
jgi:hypothetical protein